MLTSRSIQQTHMPRIQITIVPAEVGDLWDEILENVLNDVCRPSIEIPPLPLSQLIPHVYVPSLNVHHGRCYQQYTSNLCGYHAIFNTLCFLNFIKRGETNYDICNGASFWNFKRKVEKFLLGIKSYNKLKDEWPWKESDILYGDFERSYNKLCLEYFQDFDVFRNHDQFELYSFTWEFQYENLIVTEDKRREMQRSFLYFQRYNKEKPLVFNFMLAITNHWMCFIAVKIGNQAQYWFFDSFNRDFLSLAPQEIEKLVQGINQERISMNLKEFSQFFKTHKIVCMKDTQISLKLIIDCLEGRATIQEYFYNQQFNVFAQQIEKYWESPLQFLVAVKDYWYNISSFFRNPVQMKLLYAKNIERLNKMMQMSDSVRMTSEDGRKLYQLMRKYNTRVKF